MIFFFIACASKTEPYWAINHLSLIPGSSSVEGTQSWEFFNKRWRNSRADKNFLCARTQEVTGNVVAELESCEGCIAAYSLDIEEVESDCSGDAESLATDAGFAAPLQIAIGDPPESLSELDPHSGKSMGWYLSVDGEVYEPWGFAYAEELDFEGSAPPGWNSEQVYTLWPAVALEL
jgi:hypothetical protein